MNHIGQALAVAIGLALGGWFIGQGFIDSRTADRFVTVKGISERPVEPDIAIWPIQFVATNDNLASAQDQIGKSQQIVEEFLANYEITAQSIQIDKLSVTDLLANPYGSGSQITSRYIVDQTIMVNSDNPDVVRKASQHTGQLVEAGVILKAEYGSEGPTYIFKGLSQIKPEMIAEATANARESAEKFAKDSGAKIGGIRRANQGVFVILPRDNVPGVMESSQFYKTVRVVSTIQFFIEE